MDFGLDPTTGDLIVVGGMTLVTKGDELQQRLSVGLTINLGEFFTHINYGLPWLRGDELETTDIQYFLGTDENTTVQYIIKELDSYILRIDQVTAVTSTFEFDQNTRTLSYKPSITAEDGEIIDFPPYNLAI